MPIVSEPYVLSLLARVNRTKLLRGLATSNGSHGVSTPCPGPAIELLISGSSTTQATLACGKCKTILEKKGDSRILSAFSALSQPSRGVSP